MDNSSVGLNATNQLCSRDIPTAREVVERQSGQAVAAMTVSVLLSAVTLAVFIEHTIFILRNFTRNGRKNKTIVVLGMYPVYSIAALLGFIVPRSSTLVDLVANIYLGVTMLYFFHLLLDYCGGMDKAHAIMAGRHVSLLTAPCCCMHLCFRHLQYSRKVYRCLNILVIQVALIRPLLLFIAAVLWSDGLYTPGLISDRNAYIFITAINMASSLLAIYGLRVLKNAFDAALPEFRISGKFLCVQLLLLLTIFTSILLNILVVTGVIECDNLFSSKSRGDRIYHLSMVCLMVPLSLLARFNYHRTADRSHVAGDTLTSPVAEPDNNHVTYNKENDVTTNGHQSEQKLANDNILPTDVALTFENPGLVINEPKSSLDNGVE